MELAALALQQAQLQTNIGMAMIKQGSQNEQNLINMIAQSIQSSPSAGCGQNLDISI